jgi:hypothetical protein
MDNDGDCGCHRVWRTWLSVARVLNFSSEASQQNFDMKIKFQNTVKA